MFKKSLALALRHQHKIGITHTSDGIRITEENKCDPVIQKQIYEDWKKNSGQYDPKNDVIPEWEMDALHPRTVNDIKFEQYLLREYGMTRKEEIEKTFGGNIDALLKMSTIFDVFTLGTAAVAKLTGKKVWKEVGEEVGEKAVKTVAGETSEILEKELVEGTTDDVAKIVTKVEGGSNTSKGILTGKLDKLTSDERRVINDLLDAGNNVEIIPRSNTAKMPDYYVNGVKTELKTLNGNSLNTPVTRIQDGFKQGADTVIIDARKTNITVEQAYIILERATGVYGGKLPGSVEIWTIEGKVVC